MTQPNSGRGFAAHSPEEQRRIASAGGRASHASGRGHEWTAEEARAAGRRGGLASHGKAAQKKKALHASGNVGETAGDYRVVGSTAPAKGAQAPSEPKPQADASDAVEPNRSSASTDGNLDRQGDMDSEVNPRGESSGTARESS